jgi:hypothetical protein
MAENEEPEVQKRVVVEKVATTGTSRNNAGAIIAIVVIALALVIFIFMQMR